MKKKWKHVFWNLWDAKESTADFVSQKIQSLHLFWAKLTLLYSNQEHEHLFKCYLQTIYTDKNLVDSIRQKVDFRKKNIAFLL